MNGFNGISGLLELLAAELDISRTAYEDATSKYKAVGDWLNRPESNLSEYRPIIYPQGSINLGTVVKPYGDEDQYDIDLVCEILRSKSDISQAKLKELVGAEVRAYTKAHDMTNPADEGRRCWTLEYAASAQFHMDILPCIPDAQGFQSLLEQHHAGIEVLHRYAIAITDNTHPNYRVLSEDWPQSNPRGYAEWFKQKMKQQFDEQRRLIAESRNKEVQEVPEYEVKTTLQRAIQLLKRHRDILLPNSDDKPISIIITTLATQAYNNEPDLVQALINIIHGLPRFIEYREDGVWIANPVNPLENFADRWAEEPQRSDVFFEWLDSAEELLASSIKARSREKLFENLSSGFGERVVNKALSQLPSSTAIHRIPYSMNRIDESEPRFRVEHCEPLPWLVSEQGAVVIKGRFNQGKSWFDFPSDSKPLRKKRKLKFKAVTDIPGPFDVYWQVVNTGTEAQQADDLRGRLSRGGINETPAMIKEERTAYSGMHWVRCFIVKNGICVGRSAPFVVNIS